MRLSCLAGVQVLPLAETKSASSRELAVAETELMMCFREEWEDPSHPLMAVFRHMSSGLIRSQINHHLRAQIEESMEELLEDYNGTAKVSFIARDLPVSAFSRRVSPLSWPL